MAFPWSRYKSVDSKKAKIDERRRFRPSLELLEDRLAPAVFTVVNANDAGAGSLRAAVLAANTTAAADTIVFAAGMANKTITLTSGQIAISNALTITGLGASKLAISGNDDSRLFNITDGNAATFVAVSFSGLTLKDGLASTGGAAIRNTENLAISGCQFESNVVNDPSSGSGGAISHSIGSLSVTGSTFANNEVIAPGGSGGAISSSASTTLANCVFTGNTAVNGSGGAVRFNSAGVNRAFVVRSTQFVGNAAGDQGGGLSGFSTSAGSTVSVSGCTFTGNQAPQGAGAAFSGPALATVAGSTFRANVAEGNLKTDGQGGALFAEDGVLAVSGSTFDGNEVRGGAGQDGQGPGASSGGGGAAAVGGAIASDGTLTVADSTFTNNAVIGGKGGNASSVVAGQANGTGGEGGGAFGGAGGNSASVGGSGNGFSGGGGGGSSATVGRAGGGGGTGGGGGGGGARTDGGGAGGAGGSNGLGGGAGGAGASAGAGGGGGGGLGGAIAILGGTFTASGATFSQNAATGGAGGKNSAGGGTSTADGLGEGGRGVAGAIFVFGGTASIVTSTVSSNIATGNGGGIFTFPSTSLSLAGSTLAGNTSGIDGGGLFAAGTSFVANSTFTGNSAAGNGGGVSAVGGSAQVTLVQATVVGNRADSDNDGSGSGGGIRSVSTNSASLHSSIVAGNDLGDGSANDITTNVSSSSFDNLIGNPGTAGGLTHGNNGNILGKAGPGGTRVLLPLDEILDAVLRNHGGSTPTHALIAGSPALDAGESNLAPFGTAAQSSTLAANPAAEAIDRLINASSFSHTDTTDTNATWTLTLPVDAAIGVVTLHNRTTFQGRLRDITISILDASDNVLLSSPLLNPENVLGGPATLAFDAGGIVGRKMRVHRTADPDLSGGGSTDTDRNCLALAEVTVQSPTDQRGLPRNAGAGVDIGAFEQADALFSDGFNRANSATLGNPWVKQAGALGIAGDIAQGTGAAGTVHLATVAGLSVADVDLSVATSIGLGQQAALVARHLGVGDRSMYLGILARAADGSFSARIVRKLNGIATELAVAEGVSAATGSVLRFVATGAALHLYVDGTLVATVEDLTFKSGAVGVRTAGLPQLDNFAVRTLVAGAGVFDTFTQPDGTHPASYWARAAGSYRIDGGLARGQEANNLAVLNGVSAADVDIRAAVKAAGLGHRAGVVVRHIGPGDKNYYLGQVVRTATGFTATLLRNVNGVFTTLKIATVAATSGNADLRLVATGPNLRFFVNGTQVADLLDSTFARGSVGIRSDAFAQFDLFDARPVAAALAYKDNFDGALGVEWTRRVGSVAIANNELAGTASGANLATVAGIVAPNVQVSALLTLTATGQKAGLVACYNGPGDANYYLANVIKTATGFTLAIVRSVGATFTVLKLANVASLAGSVSLRVQGNSIQLLVAGSVQLSATDGTFATGGVGVRLVGGATANDFSANPLAFAPFTDDFPSGPLNAAWAVRTGGYATSANNAKGTAALNLMTLSRFAAADVSVSAAVNVPAIAGQFAAVVARQSARDLNHYLAAVTRVGTQFIASISKKVNSVTTTLASVAIGGGTGTLGLKVVGGKLTLSFNGTNILEATDFSLKSGSVGIRSSIGGELDNFAVG